MHVARRYFFRLCTPEVSSGRLAADGALRLNLCCLSAAGEAGRVSNREESL